MRVRWTTPAREQFTSAYEYIAEDNRRAASRMATRIWNSGQLLAKHPMTGREGRVEDTRELAVPGTPFLIAYRLGKNEVQILAVMHAARKWPDEF